MQDTGSFWSRFKKDLRRNPDLYIIIIPVLVYYIVFHYGAMWGAIMAFKDFSPGLGILGSPWATLITIDPITGEYFEKVNPFAHFINFFNSIFFQRLMTNTLRISITNIIFGFPAPIILALLMNELRSRWFARTVQTITYMPHFISLVVICGMVVQFCRSDGFITQLLGAEPALIMQPDAFTPIYVISTIWQEVGWGTIIYLAALAGIDQEQYEAAKIDGAGRWKQTLYVTLPGLAPQIIILFILRLGNILNIGFERVILLYNNAILEKADVLSSYVYRQGILQPNFSAATAVGLFNSVLTFILVILANNISRRVSETSLW